MVPGLDDIYIAQDDSVSWVQAVPVAYAIVHLGVRYRKKIEGSGIASLLTSMGMGMPHNLPSCQHFHGNNMQEYESYDILFQLPEIMVFTAQA